MLLSLLYVTERLVKIFHKGGLKDQRKRKEGHEGSRTLGEEGMEGEYVSSERDEWSSCEWKERRREERGMRMKRTLEEWTSEESSWNKTLRGEWNMQHGQRKECSRFQSREEAAQEAQLSDPVQPDMLCPSCVFYRQLCSLCS